MWFSNTVKFKCLDSKFLDIYPPIESKKIHRPCFKRFNQYHKDSISKLTDIKCPFTKIFNTARCPGIVDLISIGYILRLHRDIRIITEDVDQGFKWEILQNDSGAEDPTLNETVSYFLSDQFADHYQLPEGSLKTLIKINLPWYIQSKKYNFLVLQPSYFEENRFTVMNGVINSDYSPELNVIFAWHKLNSVEILKAGTPLAHLIPIPKNMDYNFKIENINKKELIKESDRRFKNKLTNF